MTRPQRWMMMGLVMVFIAPPLGAQEPELQQLKGLFECTVQQTAEGDVLHLNCTETESPLAADHDIELYRVTLRRYSESVTLWLRANRDMAAYSYRMLLRFKHSNDPTFVDEESASSFEDRTKGERWSTTVYPDFTWTSVEIVPDPAVGRVCKGCGTYVHSDLPVSTLVDPSSIRPEDAGRFLQEMQSVVLPRR